MARLLDLDGWRPDDDGSAPVELAEWATGRPVTDDELGDYGASHRSDAAPIRWATPAEQRALDAESLIRRQRAGEMPDPDGDPLVCPWTRMPAEELLERASRLDPHDLLARAQEARAAAEVLERLAHEAIEHSQNLSLSIPEAAERVGVHPQTFREWVRLGKVSTVPKGARRGIPFHEVVRLMRDRRGRST